MIINQYQQLISHMLSIYDINQPTLQYRTIAQNIINNLYFSIATVLNVHETKFTMPAGLSGNLQEGTSSGGDVVRHLLCRGGKV